MTSARAAAVPPAADLGPGKAAAAPDGISPTLLMVEDAPQMIALTRAQLKGEGYRIQDVATGRAALELLSREVPDVILLDLNLPDMDGLEILDEVTGRRLPTAVVVLTGNASPEVAVSATRRGAFDYLVKPYDAARLKVTLRNAVEHQRLAALVEGCQGPDADGGFCRFIGTSAPMRAVYRMIEAAAASKATIFITGESGTGKELCAEAIHELSPRRHGPFVILNCAAVPRDLMESEIFGHVRGAFTGAVADREGAAARADGGTLFLDELCEMPLDLQTKLLRFVQSGSYQKVGRSTPERADLRFVCATNRDPWMEVEAGRFREDLYYRMHVIPIALPPLRVRAGDLFALANRFLVQYAEEEGKSFTRFAPEAEAVLSAYDWPGNVRELQNVVRRIVVLNEGLSVTPELLPPPLDRGAPGSGHVPPSLSADGTCAPPCPGGAAPLTPAGPTPTSPTPAGTSAGAGPIGPLWMIEREAVSRALEYCSGSVSRAAAMLGVDPSTIYRKRHAWARAAGGTCLSAAPSPDGDAQRRATNRVASRKPRETG